MLNLLKICGLQEAKRSTRDHMLLQHLSAVGKRRFDDERDRHCKGSKPTRDILLYPWDTFLWLAVLVSSSKQN